MAFQPITITRIDANHYVVGRVHLVRTILGGPEGRWEAAAGDGGRPLFTASSLEEILDMAHGASEMMRPAAGYCRHYRPEGDCPECVDEELGL